MMRSVFWACCSSDDGTGDGHALALSAGELRRAVAHTMGEAHALKNLLRQLRPLTATHTPINER